MRSAMLAGLALLAGCEGGAEKAAQPEEDRRGGASLVEAVNAAPSTPAATADAASASGRSLSSAAAPTRQVQTSAKRFQALGTEPFWSFEVVDGKLLYTSPEQPTAVAIEAHMTAIGKHGDGGLMWDGRMDGMVVTLTIREGQCSDGMSDTVYPYKSTFAWGDRTEQGCARLK